MVVTLFLYLLSIVRKIIQMEMSLVSIIYEKV